MSSAAVASMVRGHDGTMGVDAKDIGVSWVGAPPPGPGSPPVSGSAGSRIPPLASTATRA